MAYHKHCLFEDFEQDLAHFGFVLSHPARQQIIRELARYEVLTKHDLIDSLPLSASAISDHLRYLERAQLIRIGQNRMGKSGYLLNKNRYLAYLAQLNQWLQEVPVRDAA